MLPVEDCAAAKHERCMWLNPQGFARWGMTSPPFLAEVCWKCYSKVKSPVFFLQSVEHFLSLV